MLGKVYIWCIHFFLQVELGEIDTSGCGSEKGCLGVPKGCSSSSCEMMVTWTPPLNAEDLSYVFIEMMGKTSGWVALGLSEDKEMVSTKLGISRGTDLIMIGQLKFLWGVLRI